MEKIHEDNPQNRKEVSNMKYEGEGEAPPEGGGEAPPEGGGEAPQ